MGEQVTQSPCGARDMTRAWGGRRPLCTPHTGPLTGCPVTLEHVALQTGQGPDGVLPVDPWGV